MHRLTSKTPQKANNTIIQSESTEKQKLVVLIFHKN